MRVILDTAMMIDEGSGVHDNVLADGRLRLENHPSHHLRARLNRDVACNDRPRVDEMGEVIAELDVTLELARAMLRTVGIGGADPVDQFNLGRGRW